MSKHAKQSGDFWPQNTAYQFFLRLYINDRAAVIATLVIIFVIVHPKYVKMR